MMLKSELIVRLDHYKIRMQYSCYLNNSCWKFYFITFNYCEPTGKEPSQETNNEDSGMPSESEYYTYSRTSANIAG